LGCSLAAEVVSVALFRFDDCFVSGGVPPTSERGVEGAVTTGGGVVVIPGPRSREFFWSGRPKS